MEPLDATRKASLIDAHACRLRALLAGDRAALERVVAQDMIYVSTDGVKQTRADVLTAMDNGTLVIERMDDFDLDVRLYGDIGIIIYSADTAMQFGRAQVQGITCSTTIYALRSGGWQMISQHQSRLQS